MNEIAAYAQNQAGTDEEVINDYLPLVKKIGLHLVAKLPDEIELDDLLQVGAIGLIRAKETYDPAQGASFSTYAGIRIKGAMLDELRRHNWAPRSIQEKMKLVSEAIKRVENRLCRSANDTEIAEELGIPLTEYHVISRELVSSRLGTLDEIENLVESADSGPMAQLAEQGFRKSLAEAIRQLPEKEQLVMALYYSEELNLKEIGAVLEVSESRVSQIHGQALARLRNRLDQWTGSEGIDFRGVLNAS